MQESFNVTAAWDSEARVWYVENSDVPGLSAEGESVDCLLSKLKVLVPELLELNAHLFPQSGAHDVPIHFMAQTTEILRTA